MDADPETITLISLLWLIVKESPQVIRDYIDLLDELKARWAKAASKTSPAILRLDPAQGTSSTRLTLTTGPATETDFALPIVPIGGA